MMRVLRSNRQRLKVAVFCLAYLPMACLADAATFKGSVNEILSSSDAPQIAEETLYATRGMGLMYASTGYQPLWSEQAIASLGRALDDLAQDGLTPSDYRFAAIDGQLSAPGLASLPSARAAELDMLFTESFLRAVYHLYFGKADPERLDSDINFARAMPDEDPLPLLLGHIQRANIGAAFDWARPDSPHYEALREGLARYRSYQASGGWEQIAAGETLKVGATDPRVAAVRQRLAVSGDWSGSLATSEAAFFDPDLEEAIKRFQTRHGLDADGAVGPATLREMNVSAADRVEQIRVNLDRERWILHHEHDEYLVADLAGFEVFWAKDGEVLWREDAQVGKEFTKTPIFGGEIKYIELNPTWTIPPGIIRRSVIPGLKKDPDYLQKRGYDLLTQQGKRVDPKTVDWQALKGFPYIVRQPAGPNNALGQVKFIFPNPHFVFLHDTNHRDLFDRSTRTFSSGCIRVRNPFDLAERLLADKEGWDRQRIDAVIASGKTTRVNLDKPMRVFVVYNTARVPAEDGQVHFRVDVYDRDASVLKALNGPFRLHKREVEKS